MLWHNHIVTARWLLMLTAGFLTACNRNENPKAAHQEVIVYSSVDDTYSRPLCERFSQATKIQVKLVPDAEETKSTGLLNRLLAEKDRPQADLFWSGDPVRAAALQAKGISGPYNSPQAPAWFGQIGGVHRPFTTFSARMRVIIFNRNLLRGKEPPKSIFDLTDARFREKACLANPLFATTSMHAAALFHVLGDER